MGPWLNLSAVQQRLRTRIIGRNLIYYSSVGSTQDVARREAEASAPEGTAVVADEQTAGRGRLGRGWVSPPGMNLYLTLVLRPSMQRLRLLTIIAPLAVSLAVEETTGLAPGIKWPNDVLIAGRKLSGVLIDSELTGEEVRYALVGPGINVNLEVEGHAEIASVATSLRRELGREVSREEVLAVFLNYFEELYLGPGEAAFQQWRRRLETLGQQVRVTSGDQVEEGLAEDVDVEGSLILRRSDGSRVRMAAGEVTLRR